MAKCMCRSIKDLTGQKFGKLTVIRFDKRENNRTYWICRCECGNTKPIDGHNLTSGNTKSCGCNRGKHINDLTGQMFGKLTVLKFDKIKNNKVYWLCQCECGNIKPIRKGSLTSGNTKSCGLCNKIKIGQKFGKLTVIEFDQVKNRNAYWICRCECGNEKSIRASNLTSGNTTSCGCLQKEIAKAQCGENSPSWKGGASFEPYCPRFNNAKKEEIREKYDRKCLICGKTEKENGAKLDVHHIDYNKDQGCGNHKWQLIPLCRNCHMKTNTNRNFWNYHCKYLIKWHGWKLLNTSTP